MICPAKKEREVYQLRKELEKYQHAGVGQRDNAAEIVFPMLEFLQARR